MNGVDFKKMSMPHPKMDFSAVKLASDKSNKEKIQSELNKGVLSEKQTFPVLQMSCAS